MNTKIIISWDDINKDSSRYFGAIVRKHSTYKEMFYFNEHYYHNEYLRKHFIKSDGKKYFIPNPFDFLFFAKDSTIIPDFIKNYKEGKKHFKKNFHKKAPDKIHIERMKKIFNDEFKRKLTSISFIYNDEIGFRNGLLSAYIEFEEVNYDLFKSSKKGEKSSSVDFEDLFYYPELADKCIDALKEIEPTLLSNSNAFVGKNKGGYFSLFLKLLKKNGLIKTHPDDTYKEAFNRKFKELNLDGSEFRKVYSRITDDIETDLNLKLSQLSHLRKSGK